MSHTDNLIAAGVVGRGTGSDAAAVGAAAYSAAGPRAGRVHDSPQLCDFGEFPPGY